MSGDANLSYRPHSRLSYGDTPRTLSTITIVIPMSDAITPVAAADWIDAAKSNVLSMISGLGSLSDNK